MIAIMFGRNKTKTIEVRDENYKTLDELTEDDYWLIDMDRNNTGITGYSDEYYYNHILFHNFKTIEQTS